MSDSFVLHAPNACSPAPGLVCCGQLQPGDLESAAQAGIRTVVSVLQPYEVNPADPEAAAALGMGYVNIAFGGPQDLTRDKATQLAAVLNDTHRLPALVHCMSGNRVGALLALKAAVVDGAAPADAVALGVAAGLKGLEFEVRRVLGEWAVSGELPA